jgi:hypothetical protein
MNAQQTIQPRWMYGLLTIGASSVTTAILASIDHDKGTPLLWITVLFWIVLSLATGLWVFLGRTWQSLSRKARVRLGIGWCAVAWGGVAAYLLTALSGPTPTRNPVIDPGRDTFVFVFLMTGFVLAALFTATLVADHRQQPDNGDIFP